MYISRNLEQWNAFLATLQTAFEQGKAQDFLTLLLTPMNVMRWGYVYKS